MYIGTSLTAMCTTINSSSNQKKTANLLAPLFPKRMFMSPSGRLVNEISEPLPPNPASVAVPGPVDDEGPAEDLFELDEPPDAAVLAVVAVVAHDEHRVLGYQLRTEVLLGLVREILHPVRNGPQLFVENQGFVPERFRVSPRLFPCVHGLERRELIVDVQLSIDDLELVSGNADHPLDEILLLILRVLEHDNLSPPWLLPGEYPFVREGDPGPIDKLVDKKMVADGERGDHGPRRYFESLHHELPDKKRDYPGYQ